MSRRIVVAIDGPAGAGKSTVARRVADALGFVYVDTGAMYRAVALWAVRRGVSDSDMHRLEQLAREAQIDFQAGSGTVLLNGEEVTEAIRVPEVSSMASRVAAVAAVRRALVEKQRQMAADRSVVMEGRDIGTVVFPEAKVKIFLDAEAAVRTRRRLGELHSRGAEVNTEAAACDLAERDRRDSTRAESPLVQAPDAVYIDSTGFSADEVVEKVLRVVRERTANGEEVAR